MADKYCIECNKIAKPQCHGLCHTCYSRWLYNNNNAFRARVQAKHREYAAHHKAEALARSLTWAEEHPTEVAANAARWRERNKGKTSIASKLYKQTHPIETMLAKQNYRAMRNGVVGRITAYQWRICQYLFDYKCFYCGTSNEKLTQDHVIPLSRGGMHLITNILPACKSCNCRKNKLTLDEYAAKGRIAWPLTY